MLIDVDRGDFNLPPESAFTRVAKRIASKSGAKKILQPAWRTLGLSRTLRDLGWFRSTRAGKAVSKEGAPIPWWSYPTIAFLDERLTKDLTVFEFGSGHSTLWLAERVREVVTSEFEPSWADYISSAAPANVRVKKVVTLHDAIKDEGTFDIVVVDGGDRPRCAEVAPSHLTERGIIVWDDSDWKLFREAWPALEGQGFRELFFEGIQPIMAIPCRTSILYRGGNCLGI